MVPATQMKFACYEYYCTAKYYRINICVKCYKHLQAATLITAVSLFLLKSW